MINLLYHLLNIENVIFVKVTIINNKDKIETKWDHLIIF